jgi:hypothetical protein
VRKGRQETWRTSRELADRRAVEAPESRDVFIQRVVAGTALARQRTNDWAEFDVNLSNFEGHTTIRRSRIRFRFAEEKRETWLLKLRVFVKQRNN